MPCLPPSGTTRFRFAVHNPAPAKSGLLIGLIDAVLPNLSLALGPWVSPLALPFRSETVCSRDRASRTTRLIGPLELIEHTPSTPSTQFCKWPPPETRLLCVQTSVATGPAKYHRRGKGTHVSMKTSSEGSKLRRGYGACHGPFLGIRNIHK
ncbi:hypothetical protein TgHK011_010130 [Trichoderma gracile]|nr:hypothetical protein TgHK011_010130 [Trichoderma gracile]